MNHHKIKSQRGAVSLFLVIFIALFLGTVTISFVRLMLKDQKQSTNSDLSTSAYDSALAGVEDAKRALLELNQACSDPDMSARCADLKAEINSNSCNTLGVIFGTSTPDDEVKVRLNDQDDSLDQAYTCVKIGLDTEEYLGSLDPGGVGKVIPLRSVGEFNRIEVSWEQKRSNAVVDLPVSSVALPVQNSQNSTHWSENRPALLRAQLINGGGSFGLGDFDNTSHSSTLFLYPSNINSSPSFISPGRRPSAPGSGVNVVDCGASTPSGGYICSATIDSPHISASDSRNAYLHLIAFYHPTSFKVRLLNDDNPVKFDGVQPVVDSTGRANELFRRVKAYVEEGDDRFSYPVAAVDTSGNLCKNFTITAEISGYKNDCTP